MRPVCKFNCNRFASRKTNTILVNTHASIMLALTYKHLNLLGDGVDSVVAGTKTPTTTATMAVAHRLLYSVQSIRRTRSTTTRRKIC